MLVDRLVASGHLTRRPDPADRRRRVLVTTEKAGADAVKAMAPLLHALDAVAARLDGDNAAAVISYLRAVTDVHRHYSVSSRHHPH